MFFCQYFNQPAVFFELSALGSLADKFWINY